MSTSGTEIAIDVLAAAAAGLVSLIPGAGAIATPAAIAAVKAAALAIAGYIDKDIDAATLMERATNTDASEAQRNKDADAYEQKLLGPDAKTP